MKRTVAKIIHNGTYRVVFDDSTTNNPYTLYHEYYTGGCKHKEKLTAYADMASCLYNIAQVYNLYGKH